MAKGLIRTRVPELEGRVRFDPEGAYTGREALARLGSAGSVLAEVANESEQVPPLIKEAEKAGVDFDD